MRFDTKIAIAVRADLEPWQKLNVTAFLASGIASSGEIMGKPYEDASGHSYLELFRQQRAGRGIGDTRGDHAHNLKPLTAFNARGRALVDEHTAVHDPRHQNFSGRRGRSLRQSSHQFVVQVL